jgi:hypothetical protein
MALQMQEESSPYVLSLQEQLQQAPTPMQDDGD